MGVFSEAATRFQGMEEDIKRQQALPTLNDLLLAASKAMDLLEGKPIRSAMKVAVIAGSIARLMGLSQRETGTVVYAALLHDIGLIRVLADIFPHLPPGLTEKQLFHTHPLLNARIIGSPHERPLSGELMHMLSQHPLAARDFVESMYLSEDVMAAIAAHHELCDGSGYPFGLTIEQIPLSARILAFSDVVECVLSDINREVHGLTTRRHALESFLEIKTAGKFDPDVVGTFKNLIDNNEDFLRAVTSLEVETMVRSLIVERAVPLSGAVLLKMAETLGGLSDGTMPIYKGGRSRKVADVAARLAQTLGIHREQCGELIISALLMDIGHLGTPLALLLKASPLTADERAIIQDHPLLTREVLKGIPGFENICLWATEHHERMNGKGYPGGKKGYEISVGGRILALADVFEALTASRPYRTHAYEPMDAIPVIGQGRMTLYDNPLVTQLRRVILSTEVVPR